MGRSGAIYLTWGTHVSYQPLDAQTEPTGPLTSRSALTFHTPYAMANIPMKVIAVFVRQFAGRDHQPPAVPFDRGSERKKTVECVTTDLMVSRHALDTDNALHHPVNNKHQFLAANSFTLRCTICVFCNSNNDGRGGEIRKQTLTLDREKSAPPLLPSLSGVDPMI